MSDSRYAAYVRRQSEQTLIDMLAEAHRYGAGYLGPNLEVNERFPASGIDWRAAKGPQAWRIEAAAIRAELRRRQKQKAQRDPQQSKFRSEARRRRTRTDKTLGLQDWMLEGDLEDFARGQLDLARTWTDRLTRGSYMSGRTLTARERNRLRIRIAKANRTAKRALRRMELLRMHGTWKGFAGT